MDNWEMGRATEIGGIFGREEGRVWNKQGRLSLFVRRDWGSFPFTNKSSIITPFL